MKSNDFLHLIALLFIPFIGSSQFTFSGEIRPRMEYRHGFKTLASEDQAAAVFIDQRTRFSINHISNSIHYLVSLQDVRTWGNQPQLVVNGGTSTGLHQAWAKLFLNSNWGVKIGRQEIKYDDQRIFGSVNWAQQARSHDAFILMYQNDDFIGHVGLAFNQDRPQLVGTNYTVPNNYKSLQYAWFQKKWNENLQSSFLFINNGVQVDDPNGSFDTNFSQTLGSRTKFKHNNITSHIALYYQGGTTPDQTNSKIKAYYLGWDFAYAISSNYTLQGGGEIISGNDQFDPDLENNAFTPLYGTNHKFNGLMDYFYVGNHIGSIGLNDFFVNTQYKKNVFNYSLGVHMLQANAPFLDPDSGSTAPNYLGTEVDITIGWSLNKEASLQIGYSQMFATESMEILKGGESNSQNNWFWTMLIIKPSLTLD